VLDLLGAGDQFGGCEVESGGEASEAGVAGVALAGLDIADPALVQAGVVGEHLLRALDFVAACLDGEAESLLERWGVGHSGSLPGPDPGSNDIRVDFCLTIGYSRARPDSN
jgi:hypothetical protein